MSISSHITCSSPTYQFSLTQSLLCQRAQTMHSTPDVSLSTQERNITLPLSLLAVLVLVQPSRRGWPSMPQGHTADTHSTSSALQILPWSQSPACPPAQLHIPGAGSEPCNTLLSPLDSWPCSPAHQPLLSQYRLAGAVPEHHCP